MGFSATSYVVSALFATMLLGWLAWTTVTLARVWRQVRRPR